MTYSKICTCKKCGAKINSLDGVIPLFCPNCLKDINKIKGVCNMINLLREKELNDYIIHKVVKGESLYSIAKKYYGKGWLWRIIYFDNKEIIGYDPDLIKEGMNLFIDKKHLK